MKGLIVGVVSILSLSYLVGCDNVTQNEAQNNTHTYNETHTQNNVSINNVTIPTTVIPQKSLPEPSYINYRLAELGYLPLNYQDGNYTWKYKNTPAKLKSFWNPNTYNLITKGAVMQFQYDNGLPVDGVVGENTSNALDSVMKDNVFGYSYVYVSKKLPEKLTLWHNGTYLKSMLCNTGIPASPTPNGTWPVYLRFLSQEMKGINPDGTHYDDAGVPYVSYFYSGCAVHGFPRTSYGSPQSLGCVEMTFADAKTLWGLMDYGTLVTIGG